MSGCPEHCYLRCCLNLAILTFSIIFTLVQVTTPPVLDSSLLPLWSSIVCSLVAQKIKNLPSRQKMCIRSLDWEGPLEKGMATHSSILAWGIPWKEEHGTLQSLGSQRVRQDSATNTHTHTGWLNGYKNQTHIYAV